MVNVALTFSMYSQVQSDTKLNALVERTKYLTPTDFSIPSKFHNQSPWPMAQQELQKINSYRAPYDKFLCISRSWEMVHHSGNAVGF